MSDGQGGDGAQGSDQDRQQPERTIMMPASEPELITIHPGMESGLERRVSDLKVGDRVISYEIEKNPDSEQIPIGEGASGKIYRAIHVGLHRQVALKFLKGNNPAPDATPEDLEQFRSTLGQFKAEARAIAKLQGENILQVYDLDEWNGGMFIAMELLEGDSAKSRMKKQYRLQSDSKILGKIKKALLKEQQTAEPQTEKYIVNHKDIEYFVNTIIQVSEQLEVAHNNEILHRDIKPGNIMYRDKEQKEAVLVDYGLAALIKAENTMTAGTPGFMSPEQVNLDPLDERTDVFGLGATLYNLLTEKCVHNFEGRDMVSVILNGTTPDIRQLNKKVDRNLAAIVHKAVAKKPEKRYESAKAFYEDLKRWRDGKRVAASPVLSFFVPTARRLKKRGLYWGVTAAVTGTLIYLAASLYKAQEPERMRNARIENYIEQIESSVSVADSLRESANKSHEILRQKSLIEMSRENVEISLLANHQKTISSVFDSYSKALELAEEWKKDDVTPEKKSEEKRRELAALVEEFARKNDYASQKVSAYARIVDGMAAYREKDFAKAQEELALAVDRLYEIDTQRELARVQAEYNRHQKQRIVQGFYDIEARVQVYSTVCRACFLDNTLVFSGSEKDIAPGTGNEWRKMKMSIEKILETPDNPILRKIPLDPKTHQDLIEYAINKAQKAFESEQSILQNSDVKREVEIKRNRAAEEKYRAELSEKYKSRKIEDDEYKLLMQLPLPSEREKFIEALENEFKKGAVPKQLYDKLRLKK